MKLILALLLTLVSTMAFAADSEITIFDDAQNSWVRMHENIGKIWKQDEPEYSKHYEELAKLQIIANKRERIIFIHCLKDKSASVSLRSFADWFTPSIGLPHNKLEKITKLYPEYDELYREYKKQEDRVRMLKSGDATLDKRKSEAVEKIMHDFYTEQASYKNRWDSIKIKRAN